MKTWLSTNGPLVTSFTMYGDFKGYTGGVYSHKSGANEGGHAVACIGYSEIKNAWLCQEQLGNWLG